MAYIVEADFRERSQKWYTRGLDPIEPDDVPPEDITDAIAEMSQRFDELTNDHFEPEPGGGPPEGTTTIDADSWGLPFLDVPKRIREITRVDLIGSTGALTQQDVATFKVTSSLVNGKRQAGDVDDIAIVPDRYLTTGRNAWPFGVGVVRLTGRFGWPATPGRVKKAVALMVYDQLAARSPEKLRAERWSSGDTSFERSRTEPTGIPEVDEIIAELKREPLRIR